jgi:diadenosine tetraphosphate (Ap4A) HIT family hydrolase
MSNCALCDLVARIIPVSVAYEDSTIFAFMDIKPVNYGHVLIVPKKHIVYLAELDEDTGAELFKVTMKMAQAVRHSEVKCEAVNLFLADGEAAGQEEFHVHMHVIPRYEDDRFKLQIDYPTRPTREELDKTAERIRSLAS